MNFYNFEFRSASLWLSMLIGALIAILVHRLFKMTPFEWKPYWGIAFIILAIGIVGGLSGLLIKNFSEEISSKKLATKHLDDFSLRFLAEKNGLMFSIPMPSLDHTKQITDRDLLIYQIRKSEYFGEIEAARYLIGLGIIKTDVFPSKGTLSWGYRFTELGRHALKEKLGREIYPKEFCELIRVRFWRREADKIKQDYINFKKEQESYKSTFGISWEDAWVIFAQYMVKIEKPEVKKMGVITRWEQYDGRMNSLEADKFRTISKELIDPWYRDIKKSTPPLPDKEERKRLLDLDELNYKRPS